MPVPCAQHKTPTPLPANAPNEDEACEHDNTPPPPVIAVPAPE